MGSMEKSFSSSQATIRSRLKELAVEGGEVPVLLDDVGKRLFWTLVLFWEEEGKLGPPKEDFLLLLVLLYMEPVLIRR